MIQLQKIERSSYMIQKEVFSERLKAAMKKQNLKQIDLVRAAQVQGIKLGKSHVSQYVKQFHERIFYCFWRKHYK